MPSAAGGRSPRPRRADAFDEPRLLPEGSFKAAEARFTAASQVKATAMKRWLAKASRIQWDYKNIVKRKGRLERLK